MERRKFIQNTCNMCMLGAAGFLASKLSGCTPAISNSIAKSPIVNNTVLLPLSAFEKTAMQLLRPDGYNFDIAVQKKADNTYTALLLQCTHMENALNVGSDGYTCSLHGSRFNKDGKVMQGPAADNLKQYATTINQNNLIIHL